MSVFFPHQFFRLISSRQFGTPKTFLKDLVKTIAAEKDLPKRVGVNEAEEFLGGL